MNSPVKTRIGGVSSFKYKTPAVPEEKSNPTYQTDLGGVSVNTKKKISEDDEDKYKVKVDAYNKDLNYALSEYGESSLEDITKSLTFSTGYEEDGYTPKTKLPNFDTSVGEMFDNGSNFILGDNSDFEETYKTAEGENKYLFQYGNIVSNKNKKRYNVETIAITAKNHPLFGNTYTRTEMDNPDYKTAKPFNELSELLSGYTSMFVDGGYEYDTNNKMGLPSQADGKLKWTYSNQGSLEKFINEIDGISDDEKAALIKKSEIIMKKYKKQTKTKTVLNKK